MFPGDDDGDDEDNDGEEGSEDAKLPSCGDYLMHFITVFWKILFAFVPPTGVYRGGAGAPQVSASIRSRAETQVKQLSLRRTVQHLVLVG